MIVGVPKEVKASEYRVGLTPESVSELVKNGHTVLIEKSLGTAIGLTDDMYRAAGAQVVENSAELFSKCNMIVKVKEPSIEECKMLGKDQIIFTYLHLAGLTGEQPKLLIESKCSGIAYETVTSDDGTLPLLAPMSVVAGKLAVQMAAQYSLLHEKGQGILLGGTPGTPKAHVVVIGDGVVGRSAVEVAVGMGARVSVLGKNLKALEALDAKYGNKVQTIYSTSHAIEEAVKKADVVVGAVLIPGAAAPKLVTRKMLSTMKKGVVLVDVAIDQGGCFETSKATTHLEPVFEVDGVLHYCVANMPGAVARTSSYALNNATLPYVLKLANKGLKAAVSEDKHLLEGLNVHNGHYVNKVVADSLGQKFVNPLDVL